MAFELRAFQRRFLAEAVKPGIDTAALSLPRGNGKSWIGGHLVSRILNPNDPLFRPGTESVLCAASIEQARIVFRFARADLEPTGGYRFLDSATRCAITHKATNTRLRVIGSNGKTAMGLVNCPWAICDEPGSWEVKGGELLWNAIATAQGKPGSPLKALLIGTLAPLGLPGHWWHDLVSKGSRGSVYVQALAGDPEKWDRWPEIRRCNPLTAIDANFRRKLMEERDDARVDARLKARFLSYRLNVPTADESTVLLRVEDWKRVCSRIVAPRKDRPVWGVDLGGGRAWSACVAVWRNGRVEAVATAPGLPDIAAQEKRDLVPAGTYRRLMDQGSLRLADGLRVPPPSMLVDFARERLGRPAAVFCDRFRLDELRDCKIPAPVLPRVTRWSEAAADIRALRRMAMDGPLSCDPGSRAILAASLAAAKVRPDDAGSVRMVKDGSNNTARDDVAAALVLAAGAWDRAPAPSKRPKLALAG